MMSVDQMPDFAELSAEDQAELRRFEAMLRRRAEKPEEPAFHAYAEVYGAVVFEDRPPQAKT